MPGATGSATSAQAAAESSPRWTCAAACPLGPRGLARPCMTTLPTASRRRLGHSPRVKTSPRRCNSAGGMGVPGVSLLMSYQYFVGLTGDCLALNTISLFALRHTHRRMRKRSVLESPRSPAVVNRNVGALRFEALHHVHAGQHVAKYVRICE